MKLMLAIIILSVVGFAQATQHDHRGHSANMNSQKDKMEIPPMIKEQVISVYKANEQLRKAFYDYNAKLMEQKAQNTIKTIKALKKGHIKMMLEKEVHNLSKITSTSNRKSNNEYYAKFSRSLFDVLEKYSLEGKYQGYYCPMAKKFWVQDAKAVKVVENPYLPSMKQCGVKK